MSIRNLDKIFKPRRVAVVGASDEPTEYGYTVLRNLLRGNFRGVVYPINAHAESVQGIHAYPNVAGLPRCPDLALLCTAPKTVPALVKECGEAGIQGVVILSDGFRETGDAGKELEQQIIKTARSFEGMRIIGPNSLGIINPWLGLNASMAAAMPEPGHLAFLSQSGALSNSLLDWASEEGIGFSHFVSLGGMLNVNFGDLLDYFGTDGNTRAIILYVHSIEHTRDFMSAARAFAKTKPIIAYKAGRFAESAQAAASHTGAMAAEDAVYEAAFQRAGIVRIFDLDDIFNVAELLACQRLPQGSRLAIVSNAGGPAIVAVDALLARQGKLAVLAKETVKTLHEKLSINEKSPNPVDLGDNAPPRAFEKATRLVLADKGVDAILVILTPQVTTQSAATAELIAEMAKNAKKPILAAWMGGHKVRKGIQVLNRAGLPTHNTPEQAVRAFMHLVTYARNLEILYETPRDIPVDFRMNRQKLRKKLSKLITQDSRTLTEHQTKSLLKAHEIPVCETYLAGSAKEAIKAAQRIGYPVALKVNSPQVLHKVDVGGVALDLGNDKQVRTAYDEILSAVRARHTDAEIKGVTVQKMIRTHEGFEMILGARKDRTFGMVIMAGMGGVSADISYDRALGLPPINERLAKHMLESLRSWPLLQGYRGQAGVNIDRLIEILIRFSYLVTNYPEIQEIDINPLLVTKDNVIALDAAIILDTGVLGQALAKPYNHLAIRPYPEEYVRQKTLKDDTPVILRPIKPEDEPLWQELVSSSSPESIRLRFRSMFKHITHEMAIRYCFIDYEREMTIVGEIKKNGTRKLIGVAGLSTGADDETAEFAVIVTDAWQGKGLGGMLLDYCMEIAGNWQAKRITAETDPRNTKMLASFRKRNFKSTLQLEEDVVYLDKKL
ncbi:MAG: bifunctional acetate--CoA ligase family protein/GNAT family N-acetyltransferase [Gammaproteobacteria bacterium]|nr:bifunctional acetate--CoA ligase family protein/GNAT family N-acetyltransferase [Gammaproteobacteria bacterium]